MKDIVILGGNARSGKTTLAVMLEKAGYNRISFDTLNDAIEDGLNIKLEKPEKELKKFFNIIVKHAVEDNEIYGTKTVIDMYDFLPNSFKNFKFMNKVEVLFLAYPSCSKEEIAYNLKTYSKPTDWIAQVNEEYFNQCVERFDKRNKEIVKQCTKYNMRLVDTGSGKQRDKVLKQLYKEIISKKK